MSGRALLAFALIGAALVAPPPAARAQSDECVLDRCIGRAPPPRIGRGAGPPPGDFDFYVLALSWSPGFCAVSAGPRDAAQCEGGARLGFVVHGLWPQDERSSPADCPAGLRPPSRPDLAAARGLFPTEGLARYEWRKHGGCTGLPPSAYFADVRRARETVAAPETFPRARLGPEDVLRAFRELNPRLRPGMAAVSCPRGVLQEVRVCLTRDLRDFTPCPEVAQRSCRAPSIEVPPPL